MSKVINTILNLKDNFSNALRRTDQNTKKFSATLHEADKAANSIIGGFGKMAKSAVTFGTVAAGAAIGLGTKSFIDFDSAVRQAAASTGATSSELSQLKDTMKDVYGDNFGESWEDVGQSVAAVQKYLKGTSNDIAKATENAIIFRDTFGADVSESMRSVDALIKNFGISADEAFNLMAQGYQNNLNFSDELIDSINEYSIHFKKVGIDAETMFAMIAAGAENGAWNVDKIGDAVKEFGIRAIDGSATTKEGFEALGLDANYMAAKFAAGGNIASDAFAQVINALKNMDDPLKANMAGVNLCGTMWEDLGSSVITKLNDIDNGFDMTKDTMSDINKIKYTGITNALKGIARQVEVSALPIGETLMPYLNEFANWLDGKLPKAAEIFSVYISNHIGGALEFGKARIDNLKDALSFLKNNMDIIIPVISGVASGLAAFVVVTKAVKLFDSFQKATKGLTIAQTLLNKTLLGNPILWIAIGIGVLVAAFVLAYKKSETFRNFINKLWGVLKEFGAGIKDFVIDKFVELSDWFSVKILPSIKKLGSNIENLWNKVLLPAAEFIGSVFGPIFVGAFDYIKSGISNAISTIQGIIEGLFAVLNGVIEFITGIFTGDWELAWQGVSDIFSGIAETMKSIFGGILNGIIDKVNWVIGGINTLADKASNIPTLGWAKDINIPLIPKFALGTNYFSGGLALVGERGPEIVTLPSASKVVNSERTKNIMSKRQSININIHVHGNLYGNETAANELGSIITKRILAKLNNL